MTLTKEKKEYFRNYYKNNKEKYKIANNKYSNTEKGRIKRNEISRRWYKRDKEKNPDKWRKIFKKNIFKQKVKHIAEKKIIIPKGQLCQRCKINLATDRHHKDYNKPLEVEFLCRKCHMNIKHNQPSPI